MQHQIKMVDSYLNKYNSANSAVGVNNNINVQPSISAERPISGSPFNAPIPDKHVPEAWRQDEILSNSYFSKLRTGIEQGMETPSYAYRGLMGDPDFNFFEYLQVSKIPYYIGGLGLIGMFGAGISKIDQGARKAAIQKTKQVAIGVAMYYVASTIAKAVIDGPIKFFRGIDMNHPYKDVVDLRAASPVNPDIKKKKEFHKVFESIDFTRWDLLQKQETADGKGIWKNHRKVNSEFDRIGKKFGIDENLRDSDSTLKEKIKQTIIMSRAWKYALTVPFVATGVGLAHQDVFKEYGSGLKQQVQYIIKSEKLTSSKKAIEVAKAFGEELVMPFGKAFKGLWKGKAGKIAILTAALGTIYANASILAKSYAGNKDTVDIKEQG